MEERHWPSTGQVRKHRHPQTDTGFLFTIATFRWSTVIFSSTSTENDLSEMPRIQQKRVSLRGWWMGVSDAEVIVVVWSGWRRKRRKATTFDRGVWKSLFSSLFIGQVNFRAFVVKGCASVSIPGYQRPYFIKWGGRSPLEHSRFECTTHPLDHSTSHLSDYCTTLLFIISNRLLTVGPKSLMYIPLKYRPKPEPLESVTSASILRESYAFSISRMWDCFQNPLLFKH